MHHVNHVRGYIGDRDMSDVRCMESSRVAVHRFTWFTQVQPVERTRKNANHRVEQPPLFGPLGSSPQRPASIVCTLKFGALGAASHG
jgi:hypothetical protein